MQRVLDWVKRKGDQNVVQYSRFGLPGEETDDRPPPTTIHVAPFNDEAKQFLIFGTHSQKAAIVSAGVGISAVIFTFLSTFFEFDWYHHKKGADFSALFGLIMFLLLGLMIHWYVIRGIKTMQPKFLVPFIIIYGAILFFESLMAIFTINHWLALSYIDNLHTHEPGAFILVLCTFAVIMLCQGGMLFSVVRCRNYLELKSIHALEMKVVEKSKQQNPGIRVIFGNETNSPNVTIANQSVGDSDLATVENGRVPSSAPPNYDEVMAPPPQRIILQGREE